MPGVGEAWYIHEACAAALTYLSRRLCMSIRPARRRKLCESDGLLNEEYIALVDISGAHGEITEPAAMRKSTKYAKELGLICSEGGTNVVCHLPKHRSARSRRMLKLCQHARCLFLV